MGGKSLLAIVKEAVEVVDQEQVDGAEAQSLQASHERMMPS